jgi:hypothetical protein
MVRFPPRNRATVLAVVVLVSQAASANGPMSGDINISETAPDRRWSRQRMRTRARSQPAAEAGEEFVHACRGYVFRALVRIAPTAYVCSARPDERGLAPCASAAVHSRRRSGLDARKTIRFR